MRNELVADLKKERSMNPNKKSRISGKNTMKKAKGGAREGAIPQKSPKGAHVCCEECVPGTGIGHGHCGHGDHKFKFRGQ